MPIMMTVVEVGAEEGSCMFALRWEGRAGNAWKSSIVRLERSVDGKDGKEEVRVDSTWRVLFRVSEMRRNNADESKRLWEELDVYLSGVVKCMFRFHQ